MGHGHDVHVQRERERERERWKRAGVCGQREVEEKQGHVGGRAVRVFNARTTIFKTMSKNKKM